LVAENALYTFFLTFIYKTFPLCIQRGISIWIYPMIRVDKVGLLTVYKYTIV